MAQMGGIADITTEQFDQVMKTNLYESTPLCRAGQPAEVAPAYVFFASQESSYLTAEMLAVTGGQPVT
jgi:hypothetical protein